MKLTDALSRRIVGDANKDQEGYSIDPMTLAIITSATIEIIKLLYQCHKDKKDATKEVNNLSSFNNRRLKRILRKKLGWKEYWRNGHKYLRSFKETGKDINIEMMDKLYKENIDAFY